jgi:hypothetical protein
MPIIVISFGACKKLSQMGRYMFFMR